MDWTKYIEARDKGLISKQKIGSIWVLVIRKFDISTGAEAAPEIIHLNPEQVAKDMATLQTNLANIQALYEDITVV